ncbi:serine/threonine-protein kinase [Streptomyces sp. NRRL B-24484]|uniref:serine/threonine-protein kinase n=1 Tax=Streptomyces sp. NRRL B-24484 TaxID=1463833 RepID=UPI0004C22D96|nr:serine/threonine-protein kinase [Streptomyces sp. NRRL B-24484]
MRPVGSKYLIEESLGRGATGTVFRGRVRDDAAVPGLEPGRAVAVKVLREELATDPDVVMRFLRERSVLLRLSHPNIVRVRDLVVEGELLALVMDLVEGPDLFRYLRSNGPLSPIAGALLMAQVADALAVSHADGVVHRDLKPANVLLATTAGPDGSEQMHPMLTDFGIARLADSPGITRTHEFVGTPAYVAPESAEGRPQTAAVDVYGAGIMLYELVTGRPPFQGDGPIAVLHAHLAQEPERPRSLPEPLWTVIERCLRKNPAERPTSPALAEALRVVAAGIGVHSSPAAVEAALAVGGLLVTDPALAAAPAPTAANPLPTGSADATQVLPSRGFDAGAATQVVAAAPGAEDRTQVMAPPPAGAADRTRVMPPVPPGAPAAEPEAPHPWQTQLRAARDRNQQTQIGYFDPEELDRPQVAPQPYQAPPPHQAPQGYQAQPYQSPQGRPPQPPQNGRGAGGYSQRPPVAPPPYQARQNPPQPPQGYRQPQPQPYQGAPAPQAYPPPQPPAPAPQRRQEPAPQRRTEPPAPPRRESAPRREPRPRSRNRMYIPGLGCLKGCLMVLLILAIAAVALWNFTDLPVYWGNVKDWFGSVSDWINGLTSKQ